MDRRDYCPGCRESTRSGQRIGQRLTGDPGARRTWIANLRIETCREFGFGFGLTTGSSGGARSTEKYPTAAAQQLYSSRPDLAKFHRSTPAKISRWTDVTPKG